MHHSVNCFADCQDDEDGGLQSSGQYSQKQLKLDHLTSKLFEAVELKVQGTKYYARYYALGNEADEEVSILQSEMGKEDLEEVEDTYKFMSDYQPPAHEVVNRKLLDLFYEKRAVAWKP